MTRKILIFAFVMPFFFSILLARSGRIVIMHSNDRHGYVFSRKDDLTGKSLAGLDVEAKIMKEIRREALDDGNPLLLVDAGDLFQGTPLVNETQGKAMIDLYNDLGYDFVTFGNHEFDYGWEVLKQRMGESKFLWLSSTVYAPALGKKYRPYLTWNVMGTKVAFLGATTTTTSEKQMAKRIKGISFHRAEEILPSLCQRLKRELGVKILILLSHMGINRDRAFAAKHRIFDLIIGGHSHTSLKKPIKVGSTWICQSGARSRYLGVIHIDVDEEGYCADLKSRLIEVDRSRYESDLDMAAKLSSYERMVEEKLGAVVGRAVDDLNKGIDGGFTPMAQLVADAFREFAGTEIGLMNTGGCRKGIKEGPVELRDVYSAVPFKNYLVRGKMKGKEIRDTLALAIDGPFVAVPKDKKDLLLRYGVQDFEGLVPNRGGVGFLVASGLRYVFDPRLKPGQRLLHIEVGGKKIEDDRLYSVAINDFLADGGDGFETFKNLRSRQDMPVLDAQALRVYFEKRDWVEKPSRVSSLNLSFPSLAKVYEEKKGPRPLAEDGASGVISTRSVAIDY